MSTFIYYDKNLKVFKKGYNNLAAFNRSFLVLRFGIASEQSLYICKNKFDRSSENTRIYIDDLKTYLLKLKLKNL